MKRVSATITFDTEDNQNGVECPCVRAECSLCGHITTSFGQTELSVRRCLLMLRKECPEDQQNFYVSDIEG